MKYTHLPYITLLLLFSSLHLAGQADSILILPKDEQPHALFTWYEDHRSMDSTWFLPRINQMYETFDKAGREDLVRTSWSIRIYYLLDQPGIEETKAMTIIDNALDYAMSKDWKAQEAELYINKGWILRIHGRQVPAFENLIKGYALMKETGKEQFLVPQWFLYKIGVSYFYVKAYDQATYYLRQAVDIPPYKPDPEFSTTAYNTLGLAYMKEMKYDSAIIAYQKAHDDAVKASMTAYAGLTSGNIGYAWFKLGDDEKALPLLEEDFKTSLETKEYNSAMNASLALSNIYLKRGMKEKAAYHLQFASAHVNRSDDRAMNSYYENLSALRKIDGDFKSALAYQDSAKFYLTRAQALEEKDILERARLELEVEKHSNEIKSLETLRKRQVLLRNGMLVIVVLTGILILSLIQRRHQKRKLELDLAQKELTTFTDMIREKNELLDSFSHEIDILRATDQNAQDERTHHLTELINSHILTEDDWKEFRILFDKVHPGFFARLREKLPDISPAETRLLALTKLQLAPREMASMLGISYESIIKSRQRLRKKVNLPEDGTLEELLS